MDNSINSTSSEKAIKASSEIKWWKKLRKKIMEFVRLKATEEQRKNELDYYQYWFWDILEEDLKKNR